MARIRFGKTALQKIVPAPAGGRLTIYNETVAKLALRVTHRGSKTFYVVKRAGSSMARVKLGTFPEMTVAKAQAEAERILGEFAGGANPAEARRAFKADPPLIEFFAEYGTRHGAKQLSWCDDWPRFRDYLRKPLGDKSLNHKSQQAAVIHARLDLDPMRASVNTATLAMLEAGGMTSAAEVVPIKQRGPA